MSQQSSIKHPPTELLINTSGGVYLTPARLFVGQPTLIVTAEVLVKYMLVKLIDQEEWSSCRVSGQFIVNVY